jgi:hypothetical protein
MYILLLVIAFAAFAIGLLGLVATYPAFRHGVPVAANAWLAFAVGMVACFVVLVSGNTSFAVWCALCGALFVAYGWFIFLRGTERG